MYLGGRPHSGYCGPWSLKGVQETSQKTSVSDKLISNKVCFNGSCSTPLKVWSEGWVVSLRRIVLRQDRKRMLGLRTGFPEKSVMVAEGDPRNTGFRILKNARILTLNIEEGCG